MTYVIMKEFAFSAAHQLAGLAADHPCSRMHGHNYLVRISILGKTLDDTGMLLDYRELAPVKQWIDTALDHQNLNEVPILQGINPTAENLARVIQETAERFIKADLSDMSMIVAVSETPKTWATWIL